MDFGSKKGKVYGIVGIASYSSVALTPDAMGVVESLSKIGLNLGAGCDMEIAPQWTAGLEVRYHMVKDFNTFAPMLKVAYSF